MACRVADYFHVQISMIWSTVEATDNIVNKRVVTFSI